MPKKQIVTENNSVKKPKKKVVKKTTDEKKAVKKTDTEKKAVKKVVKKTTDEKKAVKKAIKKVVKNSIVRNNIVKNNVIKNSIVRNNVVKNSIVRNNVVKKNNTDDNNSIINTDSFELKLSNCLEKCKLFPTEVTETFIRKDIFFKTESEYQNSFSDILSFSKKITSIQKDSIDVVMFHAANEDGLMAAYYIFKYFENKKELNFIPTRPSSSNTMLNHRLKKYDFILRNKNVIIVDLSFGKANYDYLSQLCNSIIIIDDHPRKNNVLSTYPNLDYFVGDDKHCASVYTYKFFNPKENIPLDLIYIDNNDRKLQLPFINSMLYRYITVYNNFKVIHSPYLGIRFIKNEDFKKLEQLLFDVSFDYKCLVGKLYDEVCNNIKTQIAQNAVKKQFCGHPVYILNFNDPVLYKMVSREMFSVAERKGDQIDFVVLYGWEFTSNAYKVFVSEKHTGKPPQFTRELYDILNNYGKFTTKSGKVTQYVMNFYYPHNREHDIWDMIE